MSDWRRFAADLVVLVGTLGLTATVAGTLRFRDGFMKIQSSATLPLWGPCVVLLGTGIGADPTMLSRALLVAVLLVVTSSVASHSLTRLQAGSEVQERSCAAKEKAP